MNSSAVPMHCVRVPLWGLGWWMAALTCVALLASCSKAPPELQDLGVLPPFALIDQDGNPVTDQTLQGQVWAANFLFTSCPTECPPLAKATRKLQDLLGPTAAARKLGIVSVSVDPMTDTPEVLRAFGKKYGADHQTWKLLGGEYEAMERLVIQGFMQPIIRRDRVTGMPSEHTATAEPTPLDTAHSLRFVLVDQRGHLRGLYQSDDAGLKALHQAMLWLADHPPNP